MPKLFKVHWPGKGKRWYWAYCFWDILALVPPSGRTVQDIMWQEVVFLLKWHKHLGVVNLEDKRCSRPSRKNHVKYSEFLVASLAQQCGECWVKHNEDQDAGVKPQVHLVSCMRTTSDTRSRGQCWRTLLEKRDSPEHIQIYQYRHLCLKAHQHLNLLLVIESVIELSAYSKERPLTPILMLVFSPKFNVSMRCLVNHILIACFSVNWICPWTILYCILHICIF